VQNCSEGVNKIVTTDDLAPDIGMQGMFDSAARGASDNDADTIGYEEDEEQKFLSGVIKSNAQGIIEPSVSKIKAKVPFQASYWSTRSHHFCTPWAIHQVTSTCQDAHLWSSKDST